MHHSDLQSEIKSPERRWLELIPKLLGLAQYHIDISFPYRGPLAEGHFRTAGELIDLVGFAGMVSQILMRRDRPLLTASEREVIQ